MQELLAHFEAGNLNPRVTQTHPLEAFREAFATLAERRAIGKVILKP
jgi:NADPH:quinone reductase-like Zn-dependent oxidoreductase